MKISKNSAQQIVDEIGELVHQNINLMNEKGYIIASNDRSRIGKFHEGAYMVINKHLSELYIDCEMEKNMQQVRHGINLPILVDDELQGVVGITGSYDEVIQYGQIVKKMAAILVKERLRIDRERLDMRVLTRFLEEWIFSDNLTNHYSLVERGLELGIDITQPRRCIVLSAKDLYIYTKSLDGQDILEKIEKQVNKFLSRYPDSIILRNGGRQIILLYDRSTEQIIEIVNSMRAYLYEKNQIEVVVGIDGINNNVHTAYIQANRAWNVAFQYSDRLATYQNLSIELVFDQIPYHEKISYVRKVFKNYTNEKISIAFTILKAYFDAEGSINEAANKLFIHKNTLQYKLSKIASETGFDVRKPSNAPALFVAIQFYKELEQNDMYIF